MAQNTDSKTTESQADSAILSFKSLFVEAKTKKKVKDLTNEILPRKKRISSK
ncbi:hypothetical protein [Helicobacter labetoulli]|uniref:hypothetical protein n=1 Tax=Helicobacter labetoulli TaxID=2315333 RepID=UPI0013007F42|nr:hypothetical protein [Helicobacter labetoulli]